MCFESAGCVEYWCFKRKKRGGFRARAWKFLIMYCDLYEKMFMKINYIYIDFFDRNTCTYYLN